MVGLIQKTSEQRPEAFVDNIPKQNEATPKGKVQIEDPIEDSTLRGGEDYQKNFQNQSTVLLIGILINWSHG